MCLPNRHRYRSTVRGVMPHLVGALDHATGTVLAQLATTAKSNEIPTVRTLLAALDLTGAVATIDAMHTQDDTARTILDGGGDYLMTVKAKVVYVTTSADHTTAPPRTLAAWVQHHWRIESLHWIRDVVFDEDRCQIRTGTGAETMATLRIL